jgi:hypothetical protein
MEVIRGPGAILMLPDGGRVDYIKELVTLREYVMAHAESWYAHSHAADWTMHVVTGTHKVRSYALLVYSASSEGQKIRFWLGHDEDCHPPRYAWVHGQGILHARVGYGSLPSEIGVESEQPERRLRNQCIFLHTMKFSSEGGVIDNPAQSEHRQFCDGCGAGLVESWTLS